MLYIVKGRRMFFSCQLHLLFRGFTFLADGVVERTIMEPKGVHLTPHIVRNCHTDSLCLQSYGDEVQDLTTDRVRDTTKGLAVHA